MTPPDLFRSGRHALGQSAEGIAHLLHVRSGRTVRKWEAGQNDVPGPAWVALRYMLRDHGDTELAEQIGTLLADDGDRAGIAASMAPKAVSASMGAGVLLLSNTHRKAVDRKDGAYLALAWPAPLARPILAAGEERPATPHQHAAATGIMAPIVAANGLAHIATLAAILMQPPDWDMSVSDPRPVLLAHVVTHRWRPATRPGTLGRVLWDRRWALS